MWELSLTHRIRYGKWMHKGCISHSFSHSFCAAPFTMWLRLVMLYFINAPLSFQPLFIYFWNPESMSLQLWHVKTLILGLHTTTQQEEILQKSREYRIAARVSLVWNCGIKWERQVWINTCFMEQYFAKKCYKFFWGNIRWYTLPFSINGLVNLLHILKTISLFWGWMSTL